ncbi:MAG TPA: PspC domain-containing protein [Pseudonocardia sp.]|jgi:phage shock protein PspC (stress-responsive transcriptional regulator)|nr:PspC domain-containing protein [Pseudonocardia sp.]
MSPTTEPRATLHAIWLTRPSRRQSDRKIAGVAAAIARRYDIDPVLVRIAFVVAAFYGVGILLYLAAWVTLPTDPRDPPTGLLTRRGGGVHPVVLIAAIVAGLAGAGSLLSGDPGVLVGLAVLGGLLYLLHQNRSERGLDAASVAGVGGAAAGGPVGASVAAGSVAVGSVAVAHPAGGAPGTPSTPPAWDPLGAAPFAWDLPEPGPAPGPPPLPGRRRSVLTVATIGLALLAGGVTGALVLAGHGLDGLRLVLGAMLAVVGIGLVLGAFRHAGRGLIAVAIPLVLVSYLATINPVRHWQGAGELRAAPATLDDIAPSYQRTLGVITLDLRGLNLNVPSSPVRAGTVPGLPVPGVPVAVPVAPVPLGGPSTAPPAAGATPSPAPAHGATPDPAPAARPAPPGPPVGTVVAPPGTGTEPVRTFINLEAGQATVLLPPNLNVRVHCHADMGDVDCLGQSGRDDGPMADVVVADPGAPVLELDVTVRAGAVEVRRG